MVLSSQQLKVNQPIRSFLDSGTLAGELGIQGKYTKLE